MLPQSIDDRLAQRPRGTSIDEAKAALLKQAIAGEDEILGVATSWDLWGRDRRSSGDHVVIPVPTLLYLRWERERDTDDIVLVRHAFDKTVNPPLLRSGVQLKNQPASMLPGGITYVSGYDRSEPGERIHGYADLVVQPKEKMAPEGPKLARGGKAAAIRKTYPTEQLPDLPIAEIIKAIKAKTGVEVSTRSLSRFRTGK